MIFDFFDLFLNSFFMFFFINHLDHDLLFLNLMTKKAENPKVTRTWFSKIDHLKWVSISKLIWKGPPFFKVMCPPHYFQKAFQIKSLKSLFSCKKPKFGIHFKKEIESKSIRRQLKNCKRLLIPCPSI